MPLKPIDVQQIGNEIAIKWSDGAESFVKLEALRRSCPCAACGGEPDVLGRRIHPAVNYSAASFELRGFAPVGGYALQLYWGDGHNTGIYSFDYLRKLAASASEDSSATE